MTTKHIDPTWKESKTEGHILQDIHTGQMYAFAKQTPKNWKVYLPKTFAYKSQTFRLDPACTEWEVLEFIQTRLENEYGLTWRN